MTEHKFTDEEVIKAFKQCMSDAFLKCDGCPYRGRRPCTLMKDDILELIKRQKAELEDLREIVYTDRTEAIKHLKAEAVKEFAERLKGKKTSICAGHGMSTDVVYIGHIDAVAKEMIGEENEA